MILSQLWQSLNVFSLVKIFYFIFITTGYTGSVKELWKQKKWQKLNCHKTKIVIKKKLQNKPKVTKLKLWQNLTLEEESKCEKNLLLKKTQRVTN